MTTGVVVSGHVMVGRAEEGTLDHRGGGERSRHGRPGGEAEAGLREVAVWPPGSPVPASPDGGWGARVSSSVKWGTGTNAELVAFWVGHRHPPHVIALADINPAGAQCLKAMHLGLDVVDP